MIDGDVLGYDISITTYRDHNTGAMENPICEKPEAADSILR
jgi:hypothetical protein